MVTGRQIQYTLSGSMYLFERAFSRRDFFRIAARIHPVVVKTTLTATMTVITAIKATTVGSAAATAKGFLLRINVHFKFAVFLMKHVTPKSHATHAISGLRKPVLTIALVMRSPLSLGLEAG